MSAMIRVTAVAAGLALACSMSACGGHDAEPSKDEADAREAPEVHAHSGDAHAHGADGHSHAADETLPVPPPVEPVQTPGPGGGSVVRLSTADDPDAGFVEVRLARATSRVSVRMAHDRPMQRAMHVPRAARVTLRFVDRPQRLVTLEPEGAASKGEGTAAFTLVPGADLASWLRSADYPALVRVVIQTAQGDVYVSDDFELSPSGD